VTKVFTEYASLYADRNGGYTQIFKMGPRRGDGAEIAVIKMVDYVKEQPSEDKKSKDAE
jgi:large subunit ribosomal protein L17